MKKGLDESKKVWYKAIVLFDKNGESCTDSQGFKFLLRKGKIMKKLNIKQNKAVKDSLKAIKTTVINERDAFRVFVANSVIIMREGFPMSFIKETVKTYYTDEDWKHCQRGVNLKLQCASQLFLYLQNNADEVDLKKATADSLVAYIEDNKFTRDQLRHLHDDDAETAETAETAEKAKKAKKAKKAETAETAETAESITPEEQELKKWKDLTAEDVATWLCTASNSDFAQLRRILETLGKTFIFADSNLYGKNAINK